jgi:rubrerythrin
MPMRLSASWPQPGDAPHRYWCPDCDVLWWGPSESTCPDCGGPHAMFHACLSAALA